MEIITRVMKILTSVRNCIYIIKISHKVFVLVNMQVQP